MQTFLLVAFMIFSTATAHVSHSPKLVQFLSAQINTNSQEDHANGAPNAKTTKVNGSERPFVDDPVAIYTYWLTFFTAILAIATIGLGIATGFLYCETKRAGETAKIAADAARDSADALTIAESARIFERIANTTGIVDAMKRVRMYAASSNADKEVTRRIMVAGEIILDNVGRTGAVVNTLRSELKISGERPFPVGERKYLPAPNISPNSTSEEFSIQGISITYEEIRSLWENRRELSP